MKASAPAEASRKFVSAMDRAAIRERVLMRLEHNKFMLLAAAPARSLDVKLAGLTAHTGFLASMVFSSTSALYADKPEAFDIKGKLEEIAAYGCGWIWELLDGGSAGRQATQSDGEIGFDCASPVVDPLRKLRALTEELGEIANAIDLLEEGPSITARQDHLKDEVVQFTAVSVAWLESLEVAS